MSTPGATRRSAWPPTRTSPARAGRCSRERRRTSPRSWHYFGIYYQDVPEDNPPGIDWQTGRPYTYDVNHSDGFLVFNQMMDERFVTGAAPNLAGHKLPGTLQNLLDAQGFKNLFHPGRDSWTIAEGLQAIGWVAGRNIPQINRRDDRTPCC